MSEEKSPLELLFESTKASLASKQAENERLTKEMEVATAARQARLSQRNAIVDRVKAGLEELDVVEDLAPGQQLDEVRRGLQDELDKIHETDKADVKEHDRLGKERVAAINVLREEIRKLQGKADVHARLIELAKEAKNAP